MPTPNTRHPTPAYIELRCRSAFSFLAGASAPEDLIARAAELDHGVLALGDRDGVYGAPRFHQAAKRAGVRAIVGCSIAFGDREEGVKGLRGYGVRGGGEKRLPPNPLTPNPLYLLVASRTGYRNLCRLLTQSKLRAPKGESVVIWDDLEGQTEGLICLFRPSLTPNPLTPNPLGRLQSLFPNRLYIDLQRHLDPDEERLNRALLDLARRHGVPVVATNDVRHATPGGRPLLDVLTCLHEKTTLDEAGRRLLKNAERHLKPARQMAELFRDLPEALANTRRIAEECEFTLENLGYRFPEFPLPAGETAIGHLSELTYAGARERYGRISPRVRRQLEHELAVIGKLDLAGYFLIVWDIVRFCRQENILMQGRGSAANSAVCYSLGVTAVDAVGMELLFERFLSEERGEWPDVDIDLPSGGQREKVIQYVYRRYGERGAGMTANVITYRTRSAVREVGKSLGFSVEQVDRLSKLLNRFEFRDDLDELAAQLRAGGVDPHAPRVRMLVDLVARIQNLPRHLGQHSGGMVIAAGRLDEVVPLEPASMEGRVVVQWDKDDCADLGIIKVDLLGLGMMAVLEETIPLIRVHEGVEIDLARLPPDDPKTYDMLQKADTIGVFQVESRAQMATLPRLKPDHFYDLVVEVAIIRPGPIVGQMVHPYLSRRSGREPATYAHPDLEPILKRTLGVPLFQEQLLRIAMTLAGFTGGEAEELRRAMGFKRSVERMKEIEGRLRRGMSERGIVGQTQDDIVRSITSFALYGFPESHAASFALLAYASAYLRAHHLAAFTCAMLNNWPMGFYHPATLVKDAQRHGLSVLPIDVTRSEWRCTIEKQGVKGLRGYGVRGGEEGPLTPNRVTPNPLVLRLGLRYVSGLREETGKLIEEERARASFDSIADVILRCGLRDDEAQTLAHIGAFAGFERTRREALWQVAGVSREPLFGRKGVRGLRGYGVGDERGRKYDAILTSSRSATEHSTGFDGASSKSIVQGSDRVASSDGSGAGKRFSDERVPKRGVVRFDDPDSPRSDVSSGEHRGRKRTGDEKRLRELSPYGTRQPARAGNPSSAGQRSEPGEFKGLRAPADPSGIYRPTPEPPDPIPNPLTPNPLTPSPLPEMSLLDRTLADYRGTGLTVGPQLVRHLREELNAKGVMRAGDLPRMKDGKWVKIAGLVIVRQRPGSAKGFCFLTLEDESGLANAVVVPKMFETHRTIIHTAPLLLVEGPLQIVDGVIHVRARRFERLELPEQTIRQKGHGYRMRTTPEDKPALPKSHDFR